MEQVKNRNLLVEDTSSNDCNLLEPVDKKSNSFLICKSYPDDAENYEWKIVELDEWGMINEDNEAYFKKETEEYKLIEEVVKQVHT